MTILKNTVSSGTLTVNQTVEIAHGLNINGQAVKPQFAIANNNGFTIEVDTVNVTITRTAAAIANVCGVYVEVFHSIENVLSPDYLTFVGNGDGSIGGTFPQLTVPTLFVLGAASATLSANSISRFNTGASQSAQVLTLPDAATYIGSTIIVSDQTGSANTNNITITAGAGNTINLAATAVVTVNHGSLILVSTGVNWIIAGTYAATH